MIEKLRRALYGRRSERSERLLGQLELELGELTASATEAELADNTALVGDAKQLDAVDAGKPFAQLHGAGMKTAVMEEIMRQRDPALKEAVEASLRGDIARALQEKLLDNDRGGKEGSA